VKALRKANYEKDRQTNLEKTRAWVDTWHASAVGNTVRRLGLNRE
jgi:hypothetical protein